MPECNQHFDVVILGSGFAGSLVAMILAKNGRKVALVDNKSHPRFAIGESSTPAADYLLHQLCETYRLDALKPLCRFGSWREAYPEIRCGCKRGFSYIWHGSGNQYRPTVDHTCELMVAASPAMEVADTQWYRPDLDRFFFCQALELGAESFVPAEAKTFRPGESFAETERWSIQLSGPASNSIITAIITTDFVVDAGGPNSGFLNFLQIADITDGLQTNSSAIYSHFNHMLSAQRWLQMNGAAIEEYPYYFDHAAVHHLFRDGWLWQIGFEGDRTSVGFVANNRNQNNRLADASTADDCERAWLRVIDQHPVLKVFFEPADVDQMPGRFFYSPRLQRLNAHGAGQNWAAVPFTVGFIDPLHSTGIAHTLSGVARIVAALLTDSTQARRNLLQAYSRDVVAEIKHIDRLVSGCYECLDDFRLFNCWTMIYFAAATTFERLHRAGEQPSFLLSADSTFQQIVDQCAVELRQLRSSSAIDAELNDDCIQVYIGKVRQRLAAYNQVGLFEPTYPNMYYHTAAEKP